jgi:hypothetical protein
MVGVGAAIEDSTRVTSFRIEPVRPAARIGFVAVSLLVLILGTVPLKILFGYFLLTQLVSYLTFGGRVDFLPSSLKIRAGYRKEIAYDDIVSAETIVGSLDGRGFLARPASIRIRLRRKKWFVMPMVLPLPIPLPLRTQQVLLHIIPDDALQFIRVLDDHRANMPS